MDSGTGIDKKIIERGYWIATHRLTILKWTTFALYAVIGVVYVIFLVQFSVYTYRVGEWSAHVRDSTRPFYNWQQIHADTAPQPLTFGQPSVFQRSGGVYDFVVEVQNPNAQWAVRSLDYSFTVNDIAIATQTGFILPGQSRFFTLLNQKYEAAIPSVAFSAENYKWERLAHAPPLAWNFIEQPNFTGAQVIINEGQQTVLPARVRWRVQNVSTLNVRSVLWQVGMYSGGKLVSLLEINYPNERFPFLREKDFDVVISGSVPRIDKVVVNPIVNIFDLDYTYVITSDE